MLVKRWLKISFCLIVVSGTILVALYVPACHELYIDDEFIAKKNKSSLRHKTGNPDGPKEESERVELNKYPKYFATNVDNVFHSYNKDAFDSNVNAFINVRNSGNNVFFCTGRSRLSTIKFLGESFVNRTKFNGYPGVYFNGTVVYNKNGEIIHMLYFSNDFIKKLYKWLEDKNMKNGCVFYTAEECYILQELSLAFNIVLKLQGNAPLPKKLDSLNDLLDLKIVGVAIYQDDKFKCDDLIENKDYILKYKSLVCTSFLRPLGANKAEGLKVLMQHFGEDPSTCGFIGDCKNDIEFMKLSKISYAIGGAPDIVRESAKYTVNESCNDAAFARIMKTVYNI